MAARKGYDMTTEERVSSALTKAAECLDAAKASPDAEMADVLTRQAGTWITLAATADNFTRPPR